MRDYITYIGNKLQLVHRGDDNTSLHLPLAVDETLCMRQPPRQGDDNTSLHSPLAVDETLCMRQPPRPGDDNTSLHSPLAVDETLCMLQPPLQGEGNTIQGFVLRLKKHNLHLQHKAICQRKL